ncbi:hypothetical protein MBLNU457_5990t2 [Dothideomycetes sp. NU457]
MSLLEAQTPLDPISGGLPKSTTSTLQTVDYMSDDDPMQMEKPETQGLDAHDQARDLINLIQCPQCSKPFTSPVTLPCGNSLCRTCLPEPHQRLQVTYPDTPGRRRAILCPYPTCALEHTVADCSVDVTLSKVMIAISEVVAVQNGLILEMQKAQQEHAEVAQTRRDSTTSEMQVSNVSARGRLVATYNLAAAGGLHYNADVTFEVEDNGIEDDKLADAAILSQLVEMTHKELDCQLCYNLMLDPVTTGCGHTLCRHCLIRSLDHSTTCPVCRRITLLPPSLHSHPSNKTLNKLLQGLCPEVVAARAEAVSQEERSGLGEMDTPLFVVTLGFPGCPTFLRIFEPRYRLMLRRALDTNKLLGIVMYNRHGTPQGQLGVTQFMEYGTLLRIENAQMMNDGTSIIEARGISRFRVTANAMLDGYHIGSIERLEDIPVDEEERNELAETSLPPVDESDWEGTMERMSTRALLMQGLEFIIRMQARSAPWLHERILRAYGGPPEDPALFPYWFASILPISDEAKYDLLKTRSVRQRLKITTKWIKMIESQRW